jgi:hypothetical protein
MKVLRDQKNLSGSEFRQKLGSYALAAGAAGVSAFALAQPAEAMIVYTPAHQKMGTSSTIFLDLNHDGINDFRLVTTQTVRCVGFICSTTGLRPETGFQSTNAKMAVYGSFTGNQVVGPSKFAAVLPPGEAIGRGRRFPGGNVMVHASAVSAHLEAVTGSWKANESQPGTIKNHYLGLKFIVNGETHYGWARLTVQVLMNGSPSVNALLSGYAFETAVDKPIRAGQESDNIDTARFYVSPPSSASYKATSLSLGRLALGTHGLAAWRRNEPELTQRS